MEPSKGQRILGWVLTGLASLGLIMSAGMKFAGGADFVKGMEHLGLQAEQAKPLGVVELACVILYLIPRTSFLGAVLLTGYLGGATCAHFRVGDPFVSPIVLGVVVWVGYGLRNPAVIKRAFGM